VCIEDGKAAGQTNRKEEGFVLLAERVVVANLPCHQQKHTISPSLYYTNSRLQAKEGV
jgi:hypothetical protein